LTDGAEDIVKTLYRSNVAVYILTGGIKPSVDILGKYLGIKSENIFAIDIFFDSSGNYSGYEKGSPLLSKEGKSSVIKKIKKKHKVAFIGDGANDLEAGSDADLFVGYGGVVSREHVKKNTGSYLTDKNLMGIQRFVLN
jgi:phosphoserine phosphatase